MSEKLTIELMREIAQQRGGECLAAEYKGWDDPLRWRCAKGHEWTNRAGKIKSGQWCPECAGKAPKGLPYLHELAAEKGGACLSTVYPGVHPPMSVSSRPIGVRSVVLSPGAPAEPPAGCRRWRRQYSKRGAGS